MINSYTSLSDQYSHEYHVWSRMLELLKQESAFLKTKLSQVVDNGINKEALAAAENFQNQFIIKDDFIIELQKDIQSIGISLKEDKEAANLKRDAKHNRLRNEMIYLEKSFNQLRSEFNYFLLKHS